MTASAESGAPDSGERLTVARDHLCFGCGHLNERGLKLEFTRSADGARVWTDWTPDSEVQGYPGIVHGGIITTVLDEVMGWVLSSQQIWAVTGRLNVAFRKPVEIGVEARASAWIERDAGRKLDVAADLRDIASGTLLADASGIFMRVPEDLAAEWQDRYVPDGSAPAESEELTSR